MTLTSTPRLEVNPLPDIEGALAGVQGDPFRRLAARSQLASCPPCSNTLATIRRRRFAELAQGVFDPKPPVLQSVPAHSDVFVAPHDISSHLETSRASLPRQFRLFAVFALFRTLSRTLAFSNSYGTEGWKRRSASAPERNLTPST